MLDGCVVDADEIDIGVGERALEVFYVLHFVVDEDDFFGAFVEPGEKREEDVAFLVKVGHEKDALDVEGGMGSGDSE